MIDQQNHSAFIECYLHTGTTEHADLPTLKNWIASARPGESFVYAIGDIACDRSIGHDSGDGRIVRVLDAVSRQVLRWEDEGLVFAFQRREATGFAYIAVRSYRSSRMLGSARARAQAKAQAAIRGGVIT